MNQEQLIQKTEMLIKQVEDLDRVRQGDKYAWINFKQRQRFIACTYAKNADEALEALYKLETDGVNSNK